MICILCKQGKTCPGRTRVILERHDLHLVVKNVPALVCPTCGEAYTDEETASRLLALAEDMQNAGLEADVLEYDATGTKQQEQ
jgi:YgiT-type zinc finger domain-containing protein